MAKRVGSVYAEIRAKLDKLQSDFDRAQQITQRNAAQIQSSINKINFDSVGKSSDILEAGLLKLGKIASFAYLSKQAFDLGKSMLMVNATFETLTAKLNTLTGGQGVQTFAWLKSLVKDLPVGIDTITQGFVTMVAMGLKPTAEQMLILTDVAAVLGQDVFGRVVLQLGQMTSKGKVMAQDLNILAEAGVNARKYIKDAFNMTAEQIQDSGIDIQKVMEAIFVGMSKQFGGASKEMANTWQGVTTQLEKAWQNLSESIGKTGAFQAAKDSVSLLTKALNLLNDEIVKVQSNADQVEMDVLKRKLQRAQQWSGSIFTGWLGPEWTGNVDELTNKYIAAVKKIETAQIKSRIAVSGYDIKEPEKKVYSGAERAMFNEIKYDKEMLDERWKEYLDQIKNRENEAKKIESEIKKLVEKFDQDYLKETLSEPQYQIALTDKLYEEYKKAGVDRIKLEEWYAAQILKIDNEVWDKRQKLIDETVELQKKAQEEAQKEYESSWINQAEGANRALMSQVEEYEKTNKSLIDLSERTAEAMQQNFSDLFFDAMTGKLDSFEDYATATFTSIQRAFADMAGQMATQALFGTEFKGGGLLTTVMGLFGGNAANLPINQPGFPGAEIFHKGGIAGNASATRRVPASAFSFAPRYHQGLMPNEVPAILERGETVIPKGEVGRNINVHNHFHSSTGRFDQESVTRAQAATLATLQRALARNT